MVNLKHILESNKNYSQSFGNKANLKAPPLRKVAVVTCMDARLDPAKFMGLEEGDAHVIRNAGGRVTEDVIRSLVISHKVLGTNEWYIIHHSGCGMQTLTNEKMNKILEDSEDLNSNKSEEITKIDWLTFDNLEESVVEDIKKITSHPLVPKNISIYGFIFDVNDGSIKEVAQTV